MEYNIGYKKKRVNFFFVDFKSIQVEKINGFVKMYL